MRFTKKWFQRALIAAAVGSMAFAASTALAQTSQAETAATALIFRDVGYQHRWSKDGQHEFTPEGQADLKTWVDMVTVNVHEAVTTDDELAALANNVLGRYQRAGKVLNTNSKPRTAAQPAEHFAVAVLGAPGFLEAAFARFVWVDGVGTAVVYSHRVYGNKVGPAMSDWLKANGSTVETTLMDWKKVPRPAALKRLPQSN